MSSFDPDSLAIRTGHFIDGRLIDVAGEDVEVLRPSRRASSRWCRGWVSRYGRSNDFILPTGGYKQSGIGKDLGRDAYLASCKSKTALIGF